MPGEATIPLGGPFGGMNELDAEQQQNEWELLVNAELRDGYLETRDGWKILGKKSVDSFVATPPQTVYTQKHNVNPTWYAPALAYEVNAYALGAYATRIGGTLLRFIVVRRVYVGGAWRIVATIYDELGDKVGADVNLTASFQEPATGAKPYVFAEVFDKVYFTNGGGLFVWPKFQRDRIELASFVPHPIYSASAFWLTSRGVRCNLIARHNERMFYAGFPEDLHINFTGQIPSLDDTAAGAAPSKGKGDAPMILGEGRTSALLYPAHLLWSEPGYPLSIRHSSFWVNSEDDPITAIAEYRESVVVWSRNSMFLWQGDGLTDWQVRKFSAGNGCVSQRSVKTLSNGLLVWLSTDGICAFDGNEVKVVSRPMTRSFQQRPTSTFPRQAAPVRTAVKEMRLPVRVDQSRMEWASAIERRQAGQYWVTLSSVESPVPSNVILVWDYKADRYWWHTSRELDSGTGWPGIVAWDVLIDDPAKNNPAYAMTRAWTNFSIAEKHANATSALAEATGPWDETIDAGRTLRKNRITLLGVGVRRGFQLSTSTAAKVAWLWALGRHNYSLRNESDAEKPLFVVFPEWAGYDQIQTNIATSKLQERTFVVELWPDASRGANVTEASTWVKKGRYFWVPNNTPAYGFNKWDSTAVPLDPAANPTIKWLAPELCEQRLNLQAFPSRWFRATIFEAATSHPNRLKLLGYTADVDQQLRPQGG